MASNPIFLQDATVREYQSSVSCIMASSMARTLVPSGMVSEQGPFA